MLPLPNSSEGLVPAASDQASMSGRCWQKSLREAAKAAGSAATVADGAGDGAALGVADGEALGAGDAEPEGVIDIEDLTAATSDGAKPIEMAYEPTPMLTAPTVAADDMAALRTTRLRAIVERTGGAASPAWKRSDWARAS